MQNLLPLLINTCFHGQRFEAWVFTVPAGAVARQLFAATAATVAKGS